ncbi:MAG TPA: GreA/GreB family elongation factor [Burkholderiales bacterium]|nr:GreA/GreB family elongation factor [Burkholderiales bacterium]
MSRAFVKEPDSPPDEILERPQSEHPNYITPEGLEQLRAQLRALEESRAALGDVTDDPKRQQQLTEVERELHYLQGRIDRALVVDPASQPTDEVVFGAIVEVIDGEGQTQQFAIVGEDEADAAGGKVSWMSPLAKAMLGARVGDTVTWQRPAGNVELDITAIRYPPARG